MTTTHAWHSPVRTALSWSWPVAAGLLGAFVALLGGAEGTVVAVTVVIAQSCYVAAAAFSRPWVAWAAIVPFSLLVVAARVLDLDPVLVCALGGFALVGAGLLRHAGRAVLGRHAGALVGYVAVVGVATALGPGPGLALAGLVLAAHGAWDLWLLRRHRDDVPVSLLVACVSLDVPVGVVAVVTAFLL